MNEEEGGGEGEGENRNSIFQECSGKTTENCRTKVKVTLDNSRLGPTLHLLCQ